MSSVLNSSLLKVYYGGSPVAKSTDASLSLSADLRDTTNKDTGGWRSVCAALKSATVTTSWLHVDGASTDFSTLFASFTAGTPVAIKFSTEATGDKIYEAANAFITSLEMSSPGTEENVTASVTFEVDGEVTESTVA